MRARTPGIVLLVAAQAAQLGLPRRAAAAAHVIGNVFAEDAATSTAEDETNLLQSGVNLDVILPTKKKLKTDLNMRFNYVRSDAAELSSFSPFGNLALDLAGETYGLNVQHSNYATLTTALAAPQSASSTSAASTPSTQLSQVAISRGSFLLTAPELPRLSASYSHVEAKIGRSPTVTTDTGAVSADYQYQWLQLRAGYSADRREGATQGSNESSSRSLGAGARYEVLPATVVSADLALSGFLARSATGAESSTTTRALRLNATSQPFWWLDLAGNFSRTDSSFTSATAVLPSASQQLADATVTVVPHPLLRIAATVGNRRFDDVQAVRTIDFETLSASFSRELRERILVGATAARTFESDPDQGENTTDTLALNAAADLTPRVAVRLNANVSRSRNRTFVSTKSFNASGSLADRDRIDRDSGGLPPGFTFFDVVNNDLYTKNSPAIGDWSLPVHVEPVVGRFAVSRTLQVNAFPLDGMSLSLSYAANASAAELDLGRLGTQSLNGSLTYLATRRSSVGISGTASFPETGSKAYSVTGSWSYRFARGHQLSLSYGQQVTTVRPSTAFPSAAVTRQSDTASAVLTLSLRKRTSLDATYLATQVFRREQTQFIRVRLSHSF
ncbi:MAG TPA: hypothetical protein VIV57_24460 [Anaeromyxobacter sp.]